MDKQQLKQKAFFEMWLLRASNPLNFQLKTSSPSPIPRHAAIPPWKAAAVCVCVPLCLLELRGLCGLSTASPVPAAAEAAHSPLLAPRAAREHSPGRAPSIAVCSTPFFCCLHSLQGQMEKTNSHATLTSRGEKGGIHIISSNKGEVISCLQKAMYL